MIPSLPIALAAAMPRLILALRPGPFKVLKEDDLSPALEQFRLRGLLPCPLFVFPCLLAERGVVGLDGTGLLLDSTHFRRLDLEHGVLAARLFLGCLQLTQGLACSLGIGAQARLNLFLGRFRAAQGRPRRRINIHRRTVDNQRTARVRVGDGRGGRGGLGGSFGFFFGRGWTASGQEYGGERHGT